MSGPTTPAPPARRRLLLGVRWALSGLLVALIFRRTDLHAVIATLANTDWRLLLCALALYPAATVFRVLRWRLLLRAQGTGAPFGRLLRAVLIGHLFDSALPSTIAGDSVRAYAAWNSGASKSGSVATVLADRFLGLAALLTFGLLALVWPRASPAPALAATICGLAAAAALAAWLLAAAPASWVERCRRAGQRPGRFDAFLRAAVETTFAFRGRGRFLWQAFALSLLLQALQLAGLDLLAHAAGVRLPAAVFCALAVVALIVSSLPVTIGGLGLREGVWTVLLAGYGYGATQAVAFSWLQYAMMLLFALLGAAAYAAPGKSAAGRAQTVDGVAR